MVVCFDEHGTGFGGEVFPSCLLVLPAQGHIPSDLTAKGATWKSLNFRHTQPNVWKAQWFVLGQVTLLEQDWEHVAASTSIVVGMVSHQPPADGQETNTLGFQDGAAKNQ